MSRPTPSGPERLDWLHFVGRSGAEGEQWLESYRGSQPLAGQTFRALDLLRRRRLDEGRELLARVRDGLDSAAGVEPSVRSVLERWHYGVLAYYFYCREAFDEADGAMVRAHDAVAAAVSHSRVLLPLAVECHEFRFHRARIARNRCLWREMREHVEEVRGMMEDRLPFCMLHDGAEVRLSALKTFYAALPAPTEPEREAVAGLVDDQVRLRTFERSVRDLYRLPGFVIPYP